MPRGDRGFTYVGLLALVVLIGILLAAAGEVAATTAQRDREAQLLWVGHEYRAAIARYVNQKRTYPQTLQELVGPPAGDTPVPVRFIRRLYPDPMTNAVDWVLVPAPDGSGIMGVASRSKRAPLKTGHFDEGDKQFAEAATYADWQFTFVPRAAPPKASAKPPAGAGYGTIQSPSATSAGPVRSANRTR